MVSTTPARIMRESKKRRIICGSIASGLQCPLRCESVGQDIVRTRLGKRSESGGGGRDQETGVRRQNALADVRLLTPASCLPDPRPHFFPIASIARSMMNRITI